MRPEVTEAQSPQEGVGLLQPAAALAMHHHDSPSLHAYLARHWQPLERTVMIAPHRLDRRQAPQGCESLLAIDVAGMKYEVDAGENLEEAVGQPLEELGTVRVRDDADARRHVHRPALRVVLPASPPCVRVASSGAPRAEPGSARPRPRTPRAGPRRKPRPRSGGR